MSKLLQEMQQDNFSNDEDIETDYAESNSIQSQIASVFSVVRCAAHTIQLAAYDVLKTIEGDIKECRNIVKILRTSVRSGNVEISLPCLDNATRWNSTYEMIKSIISIRDYIDNLSHINVNWIFVQNFLAAFHPIAKCTLKLQHDQYIIEDFFRDWLTCELELKKLVSTNSYAEALLNAMKKRKDTLMGNNAFIAALYMDPRFNFDNTPLLSYDQKQAAVDHLIRTRDMINKIGKPSEDQYGNSSPDLPTQSLPQDELPSTSKGIYDILTLHVNAMRNAQGPTPQRGEMAFKERLAKLCDREMESFDSNILDNFRKLYRNDADMLQLMEVVLAIPATQVLLKERSVHFQQY
ncbi:PREDICTED: uncharacterized protein LOC108367240 [Rhagoletis zephyria]|uniref:uncharacterized protein LOC108367240 n=1 Tax=Rhagoletis zephyria TaxID=28612 RepID=UPI0008118FC2|nr:PREDICTED: uncharacterized protein LOC108367240 [Rhagoletis zephyria]